LKGYIVAKQAFLKNIEKVKSSAAMNEKEIQKSGLEKKKKLINIPVEWEEKIKAFHGGTVNAYIIMALQERMQKDGLLKN
jgi:hypothetical protein